MGNQSLHSSSTSCWLSICHARKMNAERLSLFLCFHSLLRLNWSGPLPLILRAATRECSFKLESSEKLPLSVPGLLSQVLYACVQMWKVFYRAPFIIPWFLRNGIVFLIIYLFTVLFRRSLLTTAAALLTERGRVLNLQNSLEKIINQAVQ